MTAGPDIAYAEYAETFEKAADLLDRPAAWVQHFGHSINAQGYWCQSKDPKAARFSVVGAIVRVHEGNFLPCLRVLADELGLPHKLPALDAWNDAPSRSQDGVVANLRHIAAKMRRLAEGAP